jgi:hypothetical protein
MKPEDKLCQNFFETVDNLHHLLKYPRHFQLIKIVNEQIGYDSEHIRKAIGAKLKRQGRLAGVYDYLCHYYDGQAMRFAYLEAKIPPNGLNKSQEEFTEYLKFSKIPHCVFTNTNEGLDFLASLGVFKFSLDNINRSFIK